MAFKDLRDYIAKMEKEGKLIKIEEEVSVDLEIPEIIRQANRRGLYPLLFKNIKEYENWQIIANIFYSIDAIKEMLGVKSLEDVGKGLLNKFNEVPVTFIDKIKSLKDFLRLGGLAPKSKSPLFRESKVGITDIPAVKTWPKDASRYFTFSITITKDPETGIHNLSVYRIQVLDEKTAIVHWQALKRGSLTAAKYKEKGTMKVPAAIVNGVDPVIAFTATSPVPPGLDKYLFAGLLRGEGVDVTELNNGILVPSHAEVVLEGYIDLNDLRLEGPFGDHTGYYSLPEYYPTFHLEKAYVRDNPIAHVTAVGKPPQEDSKIGKAVERIFLPFIKLIIPEIVDMNLPEYGLLTGIGIFSIKKLYPGHAKKVMMSIWGSGQLSLLKLIILVDSDVNVHDINEVIYAIAANVDPQRDILIVPNALTDSLDPAVPYPPLGSKIGIDATRKFKEENSGKEWPEMVSIDENIIKKALSVLNNYVH